MGSNADSKQANVPAGEGQKPQLPFAAFRLARAIMHISRPPPGFKSCYWY